MKRVDLRILLSAVAGEGFQRRQRLGKVGRGEGGGDILSKGTMDELGQKEHAVYEEAKRQAGQRWDRTRRTRQGGQAEACGLGQAARGGT